MPLCRIWHFTSQQINIGCRIVEQLLTVLCVEHCDPLLSFTILSCTNIALPCKWIAILWINKVFQCLVLLCSRTLLTWFCVMAGWLVDITNTYEHAFPVAGGFIMLSGVMVFLLYIIRLCGRVCHHCCVRKKRRSPRRHSHSNQASQTETSSKGDWTNGSKGEWISGPPSGDQAMV
jgi:hypothetical protein